MNQLELCKKCVKRTFTSELGIVCSLTNDKPTFENSCMDYEKDSSIQEYNSGQCLRPNDQRSKILIVSIWIVLGLEIMALISSGLQYSFLQVVANGGDVSMEAAEANDLREGGIAILYLLAYITSAVLFIMWFRRAYFNLHQKVNRLSYTEGWAAGSWFVPIVNLFRPFQIMKELYEETVRILKERDLSSNLRAKTDHLGTWWGLWIISGILGQIVFRLSLNAETVSELQLVTILEIVASALGILLVFATLPVIKKYSTLEQALISNES